MKRFLIFCGLLLLIIFVMLSFFTMVDENNKIWFIFDEDTLIPAGSLEKMRVESRRPLKPVAWVFLGILLLLYLKILWKLVSSSWKFEAGKRKERVKIRQFMH